MPDSASVLVNPPLWNAYAPHLAVPLLVGTLRARGYRATGYDLSIESLDWLLSAQTMGLLRDKAARTRAGALQEEWSRQRGLLVADSAMAGITEAKEVLRSQEALGNHSAQARARRTLRDAMWLVSAAFPGSEFDLVSNRMSYSADSTRQVLTAARDPERNVYRWAFERMVDWSVFADPSVHLIGVSVSADTQLIAAITFLTLLRERRPDVHVVLGGNYATRMVERWLSPHPFLDLIDTVLTGEGEESLPALVAALPRLSREPESHATAGREQEQAPDPRTSIPGAVWRDGSDLKRTNATNASIRDSVVPAFGDLPLGKYFAPGPILPVFASRSCAWNCAFCSIPFASNSFRQRPAASVVAEIKELSAQHDTRSFMFVDEIMTLHTLDTVSKELIESNAKIRWYGETRFAGGLTAGLAGQLHESGCRRMNFGLESTSQRVLDLMRKGTRVEHIVANIDAMLSAGVPVHLFVIHGFPGETREEADSTVSFAEKITKVSAEEYGVLHTTWGGSPFALDVHSPAGSSPGEFGLTIVAPAPDADLALMRNYRVEQGLSQRESRRIASEAAGSASDLDSGGQLVWFRATRDATAREVEEFTFLRACRGTPMAQREVSPAFDWPPPAPEAKVRVPPQVAYRRVPWGATQGQGDDALAVYEPQRDRFVQLRWPAGADLSVLDGCGWEEARSWCAANECTYADHSARLTAELLLRHGFIEADRALAPPLAWRWQAELGVVATRVTGRLVLTSQISGVTARLNDRAARFWLSLTSRPSGLGPAELDETATELAWALAQHGLVYRQAVASQHEGRVTTSA